MRWAVWSMLVGTALAGACAELPQPAPAPDDTAGDLLASPLELSVGPEVVAVAAGDLDGDGHLDLAVAGGCTTRAIAILRGRGDGRFAPAVTASAGACPNTVAIADLDRDGALDLATANSDRTASVLRGLGDATFEAPRVVDGAGFGVSIAVGDLDRDDVPDLATAGLVATTFLGAGGGAMARGERVAAGELPIGVVIADRDAQALAAGDLDGDEHVDLVTANWGDNSVSVLFGNGDGTFAAPLRLVVEGASDVALADLDGDGALDLVVARNGALAVRRNLGDRRFARAESYPCGCGRVAIADVDGDGQLDVIGAEVERVEFGIQGGTRVQVLLHAP